MMTKDVHNKSNSIAFVWYIMNSVDPLLSKSNGIKNELIIISVTWRLEEMMDNQLPKLQEIGVTPICFLKKKKKRRRRRRKEKETVVLWTRKFCTDKRLHT